MFTQKLFSYDSSSSNTSLKRKSGELLTPKFNEEPVNLDLTDNIKMHIG